MDVLANGALVYLIAGVAIGVAVVMAIFAVAVALDRARLRRRIRRARAAAAMAAAAAAAPAQELPASGSSARPGAPANVLEALEPETASSPAAPPSEATPPAAGIPERPRPVLSVEELFAEAFRAEAPKRSSPSGPAQ